MDTQLGTKCYLRCKITRNYFHRANFERRLAWIFNLAIDLRCFQLIHLHLAKMVDADAGDAVRCYCWCRVFYSNKYKWQEQQLQQ